MKIKIKDTKRYPMWFITDQSNNILVHLTDKSDLLDVDWGKLTLSQRQVLWAAIKVGTLEATDDKEFQDSFRASMAEYLEKRVETRMSQSKEYFGISTQTKEAVDAVEKAKHFKELLKDAVSTLKKTLAGLSASDLEIVLKLEQLGRGRKTVLKLIDEIIVKQTKANAAKGMTLSAPDPKEFENRQVFKGQDRTLLSNISNVRESNKEQVIIKV